ncbi:MAG TPA: SUMF1/EgtB/PvdO family nonheme iron enzyme, partial [Myxococcota bacterium]|nr:SUMF1/EgtB/PvdO family nonheme iron enzyme [Myxococcota bacterium]
MRDARERTLGAYAHLDLAAPVPRIPIVNLPLWELAHIGWFQEYWCRRYSPAAGGPAEPSILPGADAMFDSAAVAHATRWELDYPEPGAVLEYLRATLEATLEALAATPPPERYFFELALLHEDMHGEALLMTLQTLALPAPPIASRDPGASVAGPAGDVRFEGGEFALGTRRDCARFVFDNEKWAHPVRVAPFAIAAMPTTQGEFAGFVEDGGYRRRELWSAEGWAWREAAGREAPLHWTRAGAGWQVRRFDRQVPLDACAPMVHANHHEARAWCAWAGRRLPPEAEWEFAARNGGAERFPWGEA